MKKDKCEHNFVLLERITFDDLGTVVYYKFYCTKCLQMETRHR